MVLKDVATKCQCFTSRDNRACAIMPYMNRAMLRASTFSGATNFGLRNRIHFSAVCRPYHPGPTSARDDRMVKLNQLESLCVDKFYFTSPARRAVACSAAVHVT